VVSEQVGGTSDNALPVNAATGGDKTSVGLRPPALAVLALVAAMAAALA
jgi:hypothetical protein